MINSAEEYEQALDRLDEIFNVSPDDSEWDEHLKLVNDIMEYEEKNFDC